MEVITENITSIGWNGQELGIGTLEAHFQKPILVNYFSKQQWKNCVVQKPILKTQKPICSLEYLMTLFENPEAHFEIPEAHLSLLHELTLFENPEAHFENP